MNNDKYYLVLDESEQGIILNALNFMRNDLISHDRCPDALDDLMLKTISAPKRKFKGRELSEAR